MSARVLIVDDEAANRKLLRVLVEHQGFEPVEADNGRQALQLLESEEFNLVLLDMMMPDLDGMAVLARLQEQGIVPALPVVMVTAHSQRDVRIKALTLGAIDFVAKPIDVLELKCRIKTLIELDQLRVTAAQTAQDTLKARIEDSLEALPLVLYQCADRTGKGPEDCLVGDLKKLTGSDGEVHFKELWSTLVHPEDRPELRAAYDRLLLGESKNWHLQYRWETNQRWVLHVGKYDKSQGSLVGALLDVSEAKNLEERYLQSQKMEAVGQLAGGIAHDFNNLLCAIISFAGFARDGLAEDDDRRADLDEVLKAADRAAGLTRQLLTFSRRKKAAREMVDLNERLTQLNKLLTRSLGETIELEIITSPRPAPVDIDPIQFDQVVLNLAVNARDAMPSGGSLLISVASSPPEDSASSPRVRLRVKDTGCGMPPEVCRRVFEPFFTTKEKGRGTGLGLATTFAIVEQAGGTIDVESVESVGTTFIIDWPQSSKKLPSARSQETAPPQGCGQVVLLAEDEPALRRVGGRILESAGYQVFTAVDGEEAKKKADLLGERLAVVVTDVVMPRVGGLELARYARKINSEIPIIFVTGYMDDSVGQIELPGSKLLWKPYQREELLRLVAEAAKNGAAPDLPKRTIDAPERVEAIGQTANVSDTTLVSNLGKTVRPRVLFVDDDPLICETGIRILAEFEVVTCSTVSSARKTLKEEDFEALVLDVNLPDGNGLDLLEESGSTPVVLITGDPTTDSAKRAVRGRVHDYLCKPFSPTELQTAVKEAVDNGRIARLRNKLLASRHGGNELVGDIRATEKALNGALSTLFMVYQPIVRAADSSIYGYEALLRSKEPYLASPQRILAAAEILGRVDEVGLAVRSSVAQTMTEHCDRLEVIFVNLHPYELNSALLFQEDPLLSFAPRVILEVTERASLQDGPGALEQLRRLRSLGYRVAVDDLGEGYAGLSSLVTLQPDFVKLDMSLVRGLHQAPLQLDIVDAIIDLAHRSGLTVVGEGVEVVEEHDVLVSLGCDLLQGYYLGRPSPPFCDILSPKQTKTITSHGGAHV